MSGLLIEAYDWTPDQQKSVRDVETKLMQRRVKYYPSTLPTPVTAAEIIPPCTDAVVAGPSIYGAIA